MPITDADDDVDDDGDLTTPRGRAPAARYGVV
jgi:hypothetical protein